MLHYSLMAVHCVHMTCKFFVHFSIPAIARNEMDTTQSLNDRWSYSEHYTLDAVQINA